MTAPPEVRSYHGQPVLKQPVWAWEIPTYFFAGGLAGASAGLACLSDLRGDHILAQRAWATAAASIMVSPMLLTADLGRPMRFMNMFRMVKVTSPMSVGSWLLATSGAPIIVATVNSWTGRMPTAGPLAGPAAALLGLPLCTYTAALIANTAVPVWHEARGTLPFVFAAGAALSAGATAAMLTPPAQARIARRVALGAAVSEVVMKEFMERRLGSDGGPYKHGPAARFSHAGRVCIAGGAALLHLRGGRSRRAAVLGGALLNTGAFSVRWSIFKAGFASVADPKYVVGPQRAAIRGREQAVPAAGAAGQG